MEEIEVPLEDANEQIQHAAQGGTRWVTYVALSSAILAVLAAVAALLSGHHVNESMIHQIQSSDKWAFYQAKGVKLAVLESRMQILAALGKNVSEGEKVKAERYKEEQKEISQEAAELQKESARHLTIHEILARAVTMFQVAIAIGAIAALTRERTFWFVSLIFGGFGLFFLLQSF